MEKTLAAQPLGKSRQKGLPQAKKLLHGTGSPQQREECCYATAEGQMCRIYKELQKLNNNKVKTQLRNRQGSWQAVFKERNTNSQQTHAKCSRSPPTKERQMKTVKKFCPPVIMAIIKKISGRWQECAKKRFPNH